MTFPSGPTKKPGRMLAVSVVDPDGPTTLGEAVTVVVGGIEQRLEIVRQERIHGLQGYWCCNLCGKLYWHLYVRSNQIGSNQIVGCRKCLGLTYRVKTTRNTAAIRAAKLRRRLGAAPGLLGELPPRPRNVWAAQRYDKLVRELARCEGSLAQKLGDMVGRRRKRT